MSDSTPRKPRRARPPLHKRALIVTAWIDERDLQPFNALRSRFFPGERNYLHAHVTLFHHIRSPVRQEFMDFATETCRGRGCFEVGVSKVFGMGSGVAYALEAAPLIELRQPLRDRFAEALTSQDARPWRRPHITVQNKVAKEEARRLLRHLQYRFEPCSLRVKGLRFYRYDYGPWTELGKAALQE